MGDVIIINSRDNDNLELSGNIPSCLWYIQRCPLCETDLEFATRYEFFFFVCIDWCKWSFCFLRWALCESLGPAERRPASGFPETPSQNCHQLVSQQQRAAAALRFSRQVQAKFSSLLTSFCVCALLCNAGTKWTDGILTHPANVCLSGTSRFITRQTTKWSTTLTTPPQSSVWVWL